MQLDTAQGLFQVHHHRPTDVEELGKLLVVQFLFDQLVLPTGRCLLAKLAVEGLLEAVEGLLKGGQVAAQELDIVAGQGMVGKDISQVAVLPIADQAGQDVDGGPQAGEGEAPPRPVQDAVAEVLGLVNHQVRPPGPVTQFLGVGHQIGVVGDHNIGLLEPLITTDEEVIVIELTSRVEALDPVMADLGEVRRLLGGQVKLVQISAGRLNQPDQDPGLEQLDQLGVLDHAQRVGKLSQVQIVVVALDDHRIHLKGQDTVELADRLLGNLLLEEVGGGADHDPLVGMGHVAQRQEVAQGLTAPGPGLDNHVLGLVVGVVIIDTIHHLGLDRPDGQLVAEEFGLPPLG